MKQSTHTSRVLRAMQDGYAEDARHQNFDGRRRDSRRITELNTEFLRWLHEEQTKKPAPREAVPEPAEDAAASKGHAS